MITQENRDWVDRQLKKMPKRTRGPVEARQYAAINCIFYNQCRDALIRFDIKREMSCHECNGVFEQDIFMKEICVSCLSIDDGCAEYPVSLEER